MYSDIVNDDSTTPVEKLNLMVREAVLWFHSEYGFQASLDLFEDAKNGRLLRKPKAPHSEPSVMEIIPERAETNKTSAQQAATLTGTNEKDIRDAGKIQDADPKQLSLLRGRIYNRTKKAKGGDTTGAMGQIVPLDRTSAILAEQFNVNEKTAVTR